MSEIVVDIWSDIICPFCWIGKRQFESALEAFPHKDKVKVRHRAFRLSPGQPVVPTGQILQQKYGLTPEQAAQNQRRVEGMAASVGLEYHLDNTLSGDSLNAHRLIRYAGDKGEALLERLYRAYFTEGLSVFDDEVLGRLAVEAGLEADAVKAFLAGTELTAEVEDDQRGANLAGARGVPHFVFANRYAVSGAQPPEVFAQALEAAWKDTGGSVSDGPVCEDGVCGI
ncbi:MAG: DsbA family oxidoreductase [Asticcacaulis sp.]